MFQANNLKLQSLDDGYVELHFDASKGSVNVFNQATIAELLEALSVLEKQPDVKGLLSLVPSLMVQTMTVGHSLALGIRPLTKLNQCLSPP